MWLYYALIGFIYILSIGIYKRGILYQIRRRDRDALFIIITMGTLLLLNCLRSLNTGNDTFSYYKLFRYYSGDYTEQYSSFGIYWMESYIDIGWRCLNRLFLSCSNSYQLFISVIAVFLYYFTAKYIKDYSPNVALSVLLFFLMFYHPYLNVLRQAMAIVIILMANRFLVDKKRIVFILCVFLATLFHKFAIVSLVLVLFDVIVLNRRITRLVIISSIALALTGGVLIFPAILGYEGSYLSNQTGISTLFSFVLNFTIYIMTEYLCGFKNKRMNSEKKELDRKINFYRWINLILLCLSIMEIALPGLYRVEYFFSIYQIVGIPLIAVSSVRGRRRASTVLLIVVLTLIVYQTGIFIFRPEWISEFPYHFYWQEES